MAETEVVAMAMVEEDNDREPSELEADVVVAVAVVEEDDEAVGGRGARPRRYSKVSNKCVNVLARRK